MRSQHFSLGRVLHLFLPTLLAGVAFVVAGCGGEDAPTAPRPPVERVAQQLARAGVDSVIVSVSDQDREYVATAGSRRPSGDQRFRAGSVTKTFTAAMVLQLAAEGRLRLSDTLERYLPGIVPRGKEITINLPCGRFWGHDGGILDYGTLVRASDDGSRVLVISARSGPISGQPPDEAALLCPSAN